MTGRGSLSLMMILAVGLFIPAVVIMVSISIYLLVKKIRRQQVSKNWTETNKHKQTYKPETIIPILYKSKAFATLLLLRLRTFQSMLTKYKLKNIRNAFWLSNSSI